jgi:hypothetical protein
VAFTTTNEREWDTRWDTIQSYYYALDDRKYHLQEYYPVKKSFYAREFPTMWRLIDEGIAELAEADKKRNV